MFSAKGGLFEWMKRLIKFQQFTAWYFVIFRRIIMI